MATHARNGIQSSKDDLVHEGNSDKPTNIEQNGGNGQCTASEQVLGDNTNSTDIEAQTYKDDGNAKPSVTRPSME